MGTRGTVSATACRGRADSNRPALRETDPGPAGSVRSSAVLAFTLVMLTMTALTKRSRVLPLTTLSLELAGSPVGLLDPTDLSSQCRPSTEVTSRFTFGNNEVVRASAQTSRARGLLGPPSSTAGRTPSQHVRANSLAHERMAVTTDPTQYEQAKSDC